MDGDGIKWPADFSELQRMDSAFKCGICYDYMKTSMITLCSHTYCSLCIRKFLQYSTKCPTCFLETHENELRNNRTLDNIIILYLEVKNKLLRALRVAEAASRGTVTSSPAPCSNPSSQVVVSTSAVTPKSGIKAFVTTPLSRSSVDKTPSARSRLFPPIAESPQNSNSLEDIPESIECKVPLMFTSTKPSSSVPSKSKAPVDKAQCPVCQVDIPSKNINIHLDACLARSNSSKEREEVSLVKKRTALPKRLYHMMSDRLLKQELKSHGLSIHGDRKAWLNRIRRFTVLYNSETDADTPRPVSHLIQQLEREEREEKKKDNPLFKSLSQKVDRYSNPDAISKANKQYIEDNKDSFQRMIEEMRSREGRNIKPTKPMNLLESDDESDGLRLVGGVGEGASSNSWDPDVPSTSSALHRENDQDTSDDSFHPTEEQPVKNNSPKPANISSPVRPLIHSDSSVDSVFDFTPHSIVASSTRKHLVKRTSAKPKSRSQSPDLFNDTSSAAVSDRCLPDAHLYQSIFGNDENGSQGRASEDENQLSPSEDKSQFSVNGSLLEDEETGSPTKRSKRKHATKPLNGEIDALVVRRSTRNVKKIKSSL